MNGGRLICRNVAARPVSKCVRHGVIQLSEFREIARESKTCKSVLTGNNALTWRSSRSIRPYSAGVATSRRSKVGRGAERRSRPCYGAFSSCQECAPIFGVLCHAKAKPIALIASRSDTSSKFANQNDGLCLDGHVRSISKQVMHPFYYWLLLWLVGWLIWGLTSHVPSDRLENPGIKPAILTYITKTCPCNIQIFLKL